MTVKHWDAHQPESEVFYGQPVRLLKAVPFHTHSSLLSLIQEPPPSEADAVPAAPSLRLPVELEFATSCLPRCPAPWQSHDLV